MTFEEFRKLALDPPQREEPTIFEVIRYDIIPPYEEAKPPHAKIDVRNLRVGFGRTLEEAEGLMRHSIKESEEEEYADDIYCFHIKEFPVGVCMDRSFFDLGVSTRLYDQDGDILDRTFCSSLNRDYGTEYGRFRGRSPEYLRFREGDKIEYMDGESIRLVEVGGVGPSVKWCWRIRERIRKGPRFQKKDGTPLTEEEIDERYRVDCTDDQITVEFNFFDSDDDNHVCILEGSSPSHAHVSPVFLRHGTGLLNACFMNPNNESSERIFTDVDDDI